jgi:hypothetical protein
MQHVVSQLIEKKRELEGKINYYQGKINILKKIVDSMEVSIKVFEPNFDPLTVTAKKFNPTKRYFENGEAFLKALDFLREKDDWASTHEITVYLMEMKKYDSTDRDLKNKIQKSILQVLRSQYKKGLIDKKELSDRMLYWKVAD